MSRTLIDRLSEAHTYGYMPARTRDVLREAVDAVAALADCQSALAMILSPDSIQSTTVLNAFAAGTAAESKARAVLTKGITA